MNFRYKVFAQVMSKLGVKQTSSAYYPESRGALERFYQTLKSMSHKFKVRQWVVWWAATVVVGEGLLRLQALLSLSTPWEMCLTVLIHDYIRLAFAVSVRRLWNDLPEEIRAVNLFWKSHCN